MSEITKQNQEVLKYMTKLIVPNMSKQDYEIVMDYFNKYHGFMSKCQDIDGNLDGYLVRIENPFNPDIVFINFRPVSSMNENYRFNKEFEKSIAILQTIKKGIRYIKSQQKNGYKIKSRFINQNISNIKEFKIVTNQYQVVTNLQNFLMNNFIIEDMNNDDIYINNNTGELIEGYLFKYMKNFENKVEKYYGENFINKIVIALPF